MYDKRKKEINVTFPISKHSYLGLKLCPGTGTEISICDVTLFASLAVIMNKNRV